MLFSRFIYGSKPSDYLFFEFYNLKHSQRNKFLTQGRLKKLNKKLNSKDSIQIFGEKHSFNTNFKEFIKRDWLYLPESNIEDFKSFIDKNEIIIVKPIDLSQGAGIFKISFDQILKDLNGFYKKGLTDKYIVEEVVKQSDYISQLNPSSLNTLRINTLVKNGSIIIVGASLRMGRGDIVVDNLAAGGIAAAIDINTGKILTPGRDKKNNTYNRHPSSGILINGFEIKDWNSIIDFAKNAALVFPQSKYIGWDIGISSKGFELIEGNYYSCWQLLQIDQVGRYELFK